MCPPAEAAVPDSLFLGPPPPLQGDHLAPIFYSVAKQLDPSRLVADSDGACAARSGGPKRPTLDFCSEQFDIMNTGAWGR